MHFSSTFNPAAGEEPAQCIDFHANMVSITCNENILSAPLEIRTKVSQCWSYHNYYAQIQARASISVLILETRLQDETRGGFYSSVYDNIIIASKFHQVTNFATLYLFLLMKLIFLSADVLAIT